MMTSRPVVVALPELMMSDASLGVDEVQGRPVVVGERVPDAVVVVDRDRVLDPHVGQGSADVLDVPLERELGCVHADHDEPLILDTSRPTPGRREGTVSS